MGVIVGYDDAEVFAPYAVGCIEAILELIEGLDEFSMKARLLTTVNALVSVLGNNVIDLFPITVLTCVFLLTALFLCLAYCGWSRRVLSWAGLLADCRVCGMDAMIRF